MADNKPIVIYEDFLENFKKSLPEEYQALSDDDLMQLAYTSNPDIFKNNAIVPRGHIDKIADPSFWEITKGNVKQAYENWRIFPEIMKSVLTENQSTFTSRDKFVHEYELRSNFLDYLKKWKVIQDKLRNDSDIKKLQEWAGNNPASWGDIFNKKGYNVALNGILSTAPILGTGLAVGLATRNPVLGTMVTSAMSYAIETQDAYTQYYAQLLQNAKKLGYSTADVSRITAQAANLYGTGAAIVDALGEQVIGKLAGWGLRGTSGLRRFSLKFLDKYLKKDLSEGIAEVGAKTIAEYASENLKFAHYLKQGLKIAGNQFIESLQEGTTEGIQYLMEEAIIDNKIGKTIDYDWLKRKTNNAEFIASVMGGFLSTPFMTMGPNAYRATGHNGTKAATRLYEQISDVVDKANIDDRYKETVVQNMFSEAAESFVSDEDFNLIERIKFAKKASELMGTRPESINKEDIQHGQTKSTTPEEAADILENAHRAEKQPTTLDKILNSDLGKVNIDGNSVSERLYNYFSSNTEEALNDFNKLGDVAKQSVVESIGNLLESNGIEIQKGKDGKYTIESLLPLMKNKNIKPTAKTEVFDENLDESAKEGKRILDEANNAVLKDILAVSSIGKDELEIMYNIGAIDEKTYNELTGKSELPKETKQKNIPSDQVDWKDAYYQIKQSIYKAINKLNKKDKKLAVDIQAKVNKLNKKKTKYKEYLSLLGEANHALKETGLETIPRPVLKAKEGSTTNEAKTTNKNISQRLNKSKSSVKDNSKYEKLANTVNPDDIKSTENAMINFAGTESDEEINNALKYFDSKIEESKKEKDFNKRMKYVSAKDMLSQAAGKANAPEHVKKKVAAIKKANNKVNNSKQIKEKELSNKATTSKYTNHSGGAKGDNIGSGKHGTSDLARKLANPYNDIEVIFRGKRYRNAEHAYQTWKSGKFNQEAYEKGLKENKPGPTAFFGIKNNVVNKDTSYQIMVDILVAKLRQHPELVKEIDERGGIEYLNKSTHNINNKVDYWTSNGGNKFMEALKEAYQTPYEAAKEVSSMKLYHFTEGEFNQFDEAHLGKRTKDSERMSNDSYLGFQFVDNLEFRDGALKNELPSNYIIVKLESKKAYETESIEKDVYNKYGDLSKESFIKYKKYLLSQGYDTIIDYSSVDFPHYIALKPDIIKVRSQQKKATTKPANTNERLLVQKKRLSEEKNKAYKELRKIKIISPDNGALGLNEEDVKAILDNPSDDTTLQIVNKYIKSGPNRAVLINDINNAVKGVIKRLNYISEITTIESKQTTKLANTEIPAGFKKLSKEESAKRASESNAKIMTPEEIEKLLSKAAKKNKDDTFEFQTESKISSDDKLKQELLTKLKNIFPFVDIKSVEELFDSNGHKVVASAVGNLIQYVESSAGLDTFPHEFFHVYETLFRNADFMKKAISSIMKLKGINEYEAREFLADYAGKYMANKSKGGIWQKIKNIYRYIISNIRKFLKTARPEDIAEIESYKFANLTNKKMNKMLRNSKLSSDIINSIDNYAEEYQSTEDNIDNDERDGDESNPGTVKSDTSKDPGISLINNYVAELGMYIPRERFDELFKLADSYKGKDLSNPSVYKVAIAQFRTKIEEITNTRIMKKIPKDFVVSFIQRANSRIPVLRENSIYTKGRINLQVKITEEGYEVSREEDHRLDDIYQTNPAWEMSNFLDIEFNKTGRDNRVIILPMHSIYAELKTKKGDKFYKNIKDANNIDFDINKLNYELGLRYQAYKENGVPLLFVIGSITGDNNKILLGKAPSHIANFSRTDLIANLSMMVHNGQIDEEVAKQIVDSSDKLAKKYKGYELSIYAQTMARIDWLLGVKGLNFFKREKNVFDTFNRLKLDIANGMTPFGLGNTGVMIFDPNEVIMESIDPFTGKTKQIELFDSRGRYVFDGQSFTSERLINKLNALTGLNAKDYKTIIRHLDTTSLTKYDKNGRPISGGNVDYVAFKMMETSPFEGTAIYKKTDDGTKGELIAKYENGIWVDKDGNEFHRLMSIEETKDRDGNFLKNNVIHTLPEESTKIKFVVKDNKLPAPFPVVFGDLMLNKNRENIKEYNEAIKAIKKYYAENSQKYYKVMYAIANNPKTAYTLLKKKVREGEIPDELTDILNTLKNGKFIYHPAYVKQMTSLVKNMFITDGAFKARDPKGKLFKDSISSSLLIKPAGPLDIKDGEVFIGAGAHTILNYVKSIIAKNDPVLSNKISALGSDESAIDLINEYLAKHKVNTPINLLVHRQPIQEYTKVQPRRIGAFVKGHGDVIFMTNEDVRDIHEADWDGDKTLNDPVNKELIDAINNYINTDAYKSDNYYVDLDIFEKPGVKGTAGNISTSFKMVKYNTDLLGSQGIVVNAKTIMTVMANKSIEIELENGKKISIANPDDKVTLFDFPLNKDIINNEVYRKLIESNGDEIVTKNNKYYLRTTKAHEFSIMLQMAVDNKKYGFLNKLLDSSGERFSSYILKRIFNTELKRTEISAARSVYNIFNYSRVRRGQLGSRTSIESIMAVSKEVAEMYYDLQVIESNDNKLGVKPMIIRDRNYFSEYITKKAIDNFKSRFHSRYAIGIKKVYGEPKISPMEVLISRLYLYDYNNQLKTNIYRSNILEYEDDRNIWANYKAVAKLNDKYFNEYNELYSDKEKEQIRESLEFTDKMIKDFVDTMDSIHKKKAVATSEDSFGIPQAIYNDEMSRFIGRWYNAFNSMTDLQKRWSTLKFLTSYQFFDSDRFSSRISRKRFKLLPFRLMSKDIMNEYINEYYDRLQDDNIQNVDKRQYERNYTLEHIFKEIC